MLAVRPLEAHGSTERRLVAPITAYVDSLWGDTTPSLHVEVDPDLRLDWTNETLALRIVQEAIGNAWRHASARSIDVRFDVVDGQLEVTISDDGVGFDVATSRSESSGLTTMRSFAALSGGELTVHRRRWEAPGSWPVGVGPANGGRHRRRRCRADRASTGRGSTDPACGSCPTPDRRPRSAVVVGQTLTAAVA